MAQTDYELIAKSLEVGCGTGHWLSALRDRECVVTGLDASEAMLTVCRQKLPSVELVHGRAEKLPWSANRFDRVLCVNAMHHFDDSRAFIGEARRVLGPGGMLITIGLDPHASEDRWFVYEFFPSTRPADQQRFAPASAVRESMRASGFARSETIAAWRFQSPENYTGTIEHSSTSQLALLTEDEFSAGMARVRSASELAIKGGGELSLIVDLTLFATRGWLA